MRVKRLGVVLTALLVALPVVGCGGTEGSETQVKASELIAAAKAAVENADAKGVNVPQDEKDLIGKAEEELGNDPLQALIDAGEAKVLIEKETKDAFDIANQIFKNSIAAARGVINGAAAGTDMTEAKKSLETANARKAQAKTLQDIYDPADGPVYWANLATQQAVSASMARAARDGQQQGVTAEAKAAAESMNNIISQMNKYMTDKGLPPGEFTVGITRVSPDAATINGVAVPLQSMPASAIINFTFVHRDGAYTLQSAG